MPYIKEDRRKPVMTGAIGSPGELNYYVTMKCLDGLTTYGDNYQAYFMLFSDLERLRNYLNGIGDYPNMPPWMFDIWGQFQRFPDWALATLTLVEFEIYRRKLGPHEDVKCKQQGDVFT